MNYREFRNSVAKFPVISISSLAIPYDASLQRQLNRWQKKKLIYRLKRGLYILDEHDRKINPSRIYIANLLYFPSYVSTEYALSYYDLIPEKVADITSITTKKTNKITNLFGTFIYQNLRTNLFFGFKLVEDENNFPVKIAEPEKAMLDFIYLNLQEFKNKDEDVFSLSYRFQNLEILKKGKLKEFAKRYNNGDVNKIVTNLLRFIEKEV